MKLKEMYIELEIYTEDNQTFIYLSDNGSSGCTYEVNSSSDIAQHVKDYIENYIGE